MTNKEARDLLEKHRTRSLSEEERTKLESWYNRYAASAENPAGETNTDEDLDEIWASLPVHRDLAAFRRKRVYKRIAVAASIILTISIGAWFATKKQEPQFAQNSPQHDIAPGGNKAILTLADGRKVILDTAANGKIASQSGIVVTKTKSGQLTYTILSTENIPATSVSYNTIETPRGGQYQVNLPDGSQVWLNAASSIRFPTTFASTERKVQITGEAYFEVAKNASKPFRVVSDNQTVEVLGTHFNVNAYTDERATRTTLLEGSVKITKGGQSVNLSPGQQSQASHTSTAIRLIKDIDTEEATAWKDGYFMFNHERIENIMRTISRWYDVEIVYVGEVTDDQFAGTVSRYKNVSEVLKKLELTDQVHFKIEGRKIMVLP